MTGARVNTSGRFERLRRACRTIRKRAGVSWYQLRRNRLTMVGLAIVMLLALVAVFAPFIAPYPGDEEGTSLGNRLKPPSREHLFGTDDLGRDVFSRVVLGARISLRVGVIAIGATMAIGIPIGAMAGFFGGWVDEAMMRLTDICLAFPHLMLALAISAALGSGLRSAMLAISLTWWPWYARLVRGQALQLRNQPFVYAARSMGATDADIILRHILPNCIGPVIVNASLDMGYIILATASLGFIGVGAQAPTPEWGLMVSTGRKFFLTSPWMALFPGLAIFVAVLGFNLLGDGLRDVFDPRSRPR
ncbi:MAG: ABC transporter permease [Firmicutes bacterium]|nr:ABC transporter permease [Bacillota bacterium]